MITMLIRPKLFIAIGALLVVLGFVFPLLMVIQILKSTLFLNFFSYSASVGGLALGMIGFAYLSRMNQR